MFARHEIEMIWYLSAFSQSNNPTEPCHGSLNGTSQCLQTFKLFDVLSMLSNKPAHTNKIMEVYFLLGEKFILVFAKNRSIVFGGGEVMANETRLLRKEVF